METTLALKEAEFAKLIREKDDKIEERNEMSRDDQKEMIMATNKMTEVMHTFKTLYDGRKRDQKKEA